MKILFSHYLVTDDNVPVSSIRCLAEGLQDLGHEVKIHRSFGEPLSNPDANKNGSAPTRRKRGAWFRNKLWFMRASARNLSMKRRDLAVIEQFQPDVIVVRHDPYCCSMSLAAGECSKPMVMYADLPAAYEQRLYHSHERWHPPWILEEIERLALSRSQAVIATSHPTAAKIESDYHLGLPTTVVPNGLYPERFPLLEPSVRASIRRELGIERPHVLGFQGSFRAFHGIDRLRELMLSTGARGDTHWLLIGDGPLKAELQESIGTRIPVTFLGQRPAQEMGRWLGLIDVAVAPYEYVKGIFYLSPLKIIEYAASGCAIVASRQGDIPWLLDDGKAGLLLEDPDITVWSEAILSLLDDPARREQLGRDARAYVVDRFTWARSAENYSEVITQVFEQHVASDRHLVKPREGSSS